MNTDTLIALLVFAAVLIPLSLWIGFGTKRPSSIDRAAGVHFGQVSPEEDAFQHQPDGPTPHLLASQCMTCRAILCVDRCWLPESLVPLPAGCNVSHGLCPRCERAAQEEINRIVAGEIRTPALTH